MNNYVALSLLILCVYTKDSRSDVQLLEECEPEAQGKEWYDDENCIKHTCTKGFVIDSMCPTVTNTKETCFINLYPGGSFPNCCPKLICDDDIQMSTPEEEFEVSTPEEEIEVSTPEEEFEVSTPKESFEVSTPEEEGSGSGSGGGEYPDLEIEDDDFETTFSPTDVKTTTFDPNFYEVETEKGDESEEVPFEVSSPEEEGSGAGADSESGSGSGGGEYPDLEGGDDDDETTFSPTESGSGGVEYPDSETEEYEYEYDTMYPPTGGEITTFGPNFYEVETDKDDGGEDEDEGLKIHLMGDFDGTKFDVGIEGTGTGSEEAMLLELLDYFEGKKFEIEIEKHREKKKDLLMKLLHKFSGKSFGVVVEKSSNKE